MDSYTLIFITMELIFIMVVIILALKMNKNIGTFSEVSHFRNIQIMFIIGALTEIIWALQNAGIISLLVWQAWIMNGVTVGSFSVLLYEWFCFIAHKVLERKEEKLVLTSMRIQTVVVCIDVLMIASSFATGLVYQIAPDSTYLRGPYYWLHSMFCYSHWIWTTILTIHYLRQRSLKERRQLYNMFIVSLFPFFGGILQLVNKQIPFLDASIMLGTLLIFINLQEDQITTDALTGLNNRSDFVKMYERLLASADTNPFVMFVADIDKFKRINDRYGHLVGDRALLLVAKGLRKIGSQHHSLYICRYGGDEFVMLGVCKDIPNPDTFAKEVNIALHEEAKEAALGFDITFTIGYQKIDDKNMTLKDMFDKADMMLYQMKQNKPSI